MKRLIIFLAFLLPILAVRAQLPTKVLASKANKYLGQSEVYSVSIQFKKRADQFQSVKVLLFNKQTHKNSSLKVKGVPASAKVQDGHLVIAGEKKGRLTVQKVGLDLDQKDKATLSFDGPENSESLHALSPKGHHAWYFKVKGEALLENKHLLSVRDANLEVIQDFSDLGARFPRFERMVRPSHLQLRGQKDLYIAFNWNGALYHIRYSERGTQMLREVYFRLLGNKVRTSAMQLSKKRVTLAGLFAAPGQSGAGDTLLVVNYWESGPTETNHSIDLDTLLPNDDEKGPYGQEVLGIVPQREGSTGVFLGRYRENEKGQRIYFRVCRVLVGLDGTALAADHQPITALGQMDQYGGVETSALQLLRFPNQPEKSLLVVPGVGKVYAFGFEKDGLVQHTFDRPNTSNLKGVPYRSTIDPTITEIEAFKSKEGQWLAVVAYPFAQKRNLLLALKFPNKP